MFRTQCSTGKQEEDILFFWERYFSLHTFSNVPSTFPSFPRHVYIKWNERLFQELYRAYKAGRLAKDPSTFWFQGELGFFDNYVIPLAQKMKDCGVLVCHRMNT